MLLNLLRVNSTRSVFCDAVSRGSYPSGTRSVFCDAVSPGFFPSSVVTPISHPLSKWHSFRFVFKGGFCLQCFAASPVFFTGCLHVFTVLMFSLPAVLCSQSSVLYWMSSCLHCLHDFTARSLANSFCERDNDISSHPHPKRHSFRFVFLLQRLFYNWIM